MAAPALLDEPEDITAPSADDGGDGLIDRVRRLETDLADVRHTISELADIVVGDIKERRAVPPASDAYVVPPSVIPGGQVTLTAVAGVLRPWLDGKGEFDWATGDARLVEGDILTVRGVVGPVNVAVAAEAGARAEARLRVTTQGPTRKFALPSRERAPLSFQASPDAQGVLFRLRVEEGDVSLTGFHFTPAAGGTP